MRRPARSRRRAAAAVIAVAAAALLLPAGASAVNVLHTFNADSQGWLAYADNTCDGPTAHPANYSASGGNPGGYLAITDNESPAPNPGELDFCPWLIASPSAFSGQARANYGGTFAFDLKHPAGADGGPDIQMATSDGRVIVYVNATPPPANTWTTYTFPLTTANAYYADDSTDPVPATSAQVFDVLANLAQVQILGDISTNSRGDTTGIDNVQLSEPPSPLDTDGDGVTNAADQCPTVVGTAANNGCPEQSNEACDKAQAALDKAKAALKKAKKNGSKKKIKKAKAKVKKAKVKVKKECD